MNYGDKLLVSERLTIFRSMRKQQYTLFLVGESDFRNPIEILGPALNGLIPELQDRKLVMDFRGLTFMNSSSVTPILMFVKAVCMQGIPVHLIYNSKLSWQRTTASSMRVFVHALKLLTVDLVAPESSAEG